MTMVSVPDLQPVSGLLLGLAYMRSLTMILTPTM